ncbi:ABC transporter permease [Ancylobacter terrae]|uniref:ABC transporter permease n=1 Tax=Ancylobacter sp. sgz301288 TaxID=3342077 RepID=UPI00385BEB61
MTVQSLAPAEQSSIADDQARIKAASARRRRREGMQVILIRVISLIVALTLWQIVGSNIDPILFTTPIAVAKAAVQMIGSGELWQYLAPSLLVFIYGLALAAVAGISMGLALARYRTLDAAFDMYITFLYCTPTVALVPLIVLWAGYDMTAKVIILFLFAFFPLVINTYQGVKNVDPKLLEVGKAFRCSEWQLWRNIIIPAALPFIVTGVRLAVGRGLIGMVLADLYTAISGIGYLILRTASTFQIDRMFVPIVTLGILGVLSTALVRLLEKKVAPWTNAPRD